MFTQIIMKQCGVTAASFLSCSRILNTNNANPVAQPEPITSHSLSFLHKLIGAVTESMALFYMLSPRRRTYDSDTDSDTGIDTGTDTETDTD
jgi:hypothetical protein